MLVVLAYGAANLSSLLFATGSDSIALFWPGNGLLVAVWALAGKRWHGPILALALAGVFLTNLAQGKDAVPSLLLAVANAVEIALAAFLMRGIPGQAAFLAEERGVLHFFPRVTLLAGAGASLPGGMVAAVFLGGAFWYQILNWFLIDAAAMAVVTPLVLAWAKPEFAWSREERRGPEFLACIVLSAAYAAGIFAHRSWLWIAFGSPLVYGTFFFLVWGALRFGSRGGTAVLFLNYAISAWFTCRGEGPFAEGAIAKSLYLPMYLFPYAAAFCSLLPAAMFHSQKRFREQLIHRDSRYGKLWASKLIGIYVVDLGGRLHEGNDAFLRMIRRSRDDLEAGALNMLDMATPEYLTRVEEQRERFLRDGQIGPIEREWVLQDGSRFHSQVYARAMDEPELILGMVMDTEDLWRAQAQLRLRESRYRDLLSSDLVGIFVTDLDAKILEANDTFLRMIARTRPELEAGEINSLAMAPPEYVTGNVARRELFRATGRMGPYEREWIRADGSRLHTLFLAMRMHDSENALCMVLDTSELKQAKVELRAIEARFKSLFDSNLIAVAVAGAAGTVAEANRAFLGMLGYTQADLETGAIALDRIAPFDAQQGPGGAEAKAAAHVDPGERFFFRKDGTSLPVYRVVTRLNGGNSSMIIAIDLTESKRVQRDLAEATEKAQAASQAKSEFLSHMSHEIRTPLNGVLGMLELLSGTELDAIQDSYVRTCIENGGHLLGLINHVLDFSKIESGAIETENVPFRLRTVMERALNSLSQNARRKGVGWVEMLDPALDRVFSGDPVRIQQILFNLAGNAVKFTERGTIRIRAFALDKSPSGVRARFEVEDTGPGIPADVAAGLFQPFRQGDASLARKAGGAGLGLAISKGLVEKLGGAISMESEVGKGSLFRFEIPLAFAREFPVRKRPRLRAAGTPARTWVRPPRVLVVDDNAVNLTVARAFLEKLGCDVETAADGPAAVHAAERKPFDVVFMDCQLPGMDGFEATRRLRASEGPNAGVPILALTAHVGKDFRDKCLAAGMSDYVSKPFSLENLSEALGTWYGKGPQGPPVQDAEAEAEADADADDAAGPGPVDWARLNALDEAGPAGEDLVGKLIGLFVEMAEDGLGILRRENKAGRKPEMAMEAHKLRGACGMIGALGMQSILDELEDNIGRDSTEGMPGLLDRLETEFARTRRALASREGLPPPRPARPGKG